MLAGTNPLKMFWADAHGWTIGSRTSNSIVLEREGAPMGLGGQRLRVKVWLRTDKGYCPSRVEM
ncbi:MAG: hypothetical protein NZ550_00375 [Fimbriimonadales bacterium]|nr:hypothetical protein [Fimbriimonadales bacterium]MDW8052132.1 hypothetical protein [Armatimonadota bacterium]